MTVCITGGAGFIGSNFILDWLKQSDETIINVDKLNYAGNVNNLLQINNDQRHVFLQGDIGDTLFMSNICQKYSPRAIINFAAETHVDRSVYGPEDFMHTNIMGTFKLLEVIRHYFAKLPQDKQKAFRFVHISTDEVYGSLTKEEPAFTEEHPYKPNSPYSASKASSDHLIRAYYHTYGLPVLTTNCSNNYGPYQFPEKLIPLMIHNALSHKPLPIYGDGLQVRDWLYVTDHCSAIRAVMEKGEPGNVYNIGGLNEKTNIDIVHHLCDILDELYPVQSSVTISRYCDLITYVKDRPGHDRRYAVNATKIHIDLGWLPSESFETGIRKTVIWYLKNKKWMQNIISGEYRKWVKKHYI